MNRDYNFDPTSGNERLKQLSLIIPTFNRSEHLARLLKYYAAKNTDIHFLILDSSQAETIALNRENCSLLGKHAKHIVFPQSMPFATKLLNGLKQVETPFCAFCADDDLVFIESLIRALDYLHHNPQFVCVDGIYLNFAIQGHDIKINVEHVNKGITANHPGARIFTHLQTYEPLFYGVFQTTNLLKIFTAMPDIPTLHYQELFQAIAALLLGKSQRLPLFYGARQACQAADPSRDKWQTFYWFAENRVEFLQHYIHYRSILWQFYETHLPTSKLTKDDFYQIMDLAHTVFFATKCSPVYFHSVLQSHWPNDVYQQSNLHPGATCQQLKAPHKIIWKSRVKSLIRFVQKNIVSYWTRKNINTLNNQMQKKFFTQWNCKPDNELGWLAADDDFRQAYQELCFYLD